MRVKETLQRHLKTNHLKIEEMDQKIRTWLPRRQAAHMIDIPLDVFDLQPKTNGMDFRDIKKK